MNKNLTGISEKNALPCASLSWILSVPIQVIANMLQSTYFMFNIEQAPCLVFRPGIYPVLKDRQLPDADAHWTFLMHYIIWDLCHELLFWLDTGSETERSCHT